MPLQLFLAETADFNPDILHQLSPWVEVTTGECNQETLSIVLQHCDIFWFRLAYKLDVTVLQAGIRCKVLVTPVTGIDHIDEALCQRLGIQIICLRGEREFLKEIRATAELTVGLTLSLLRHIPSAVQSVKAGLWDRDLFRGRELFQKTAGIVGFGRLGRIVAEYFHAMGVNILAYDVEEKEPWPSYVTKVNSLTDLARQSDMVSIHVAYNKASHHLIDAAFFDALPTHAVIINTARGGVIDEAALLSALKTGRISGAALDVLQGEPDIDETHPLVAYAKANNNLLLVPHIGGNTFESFAKTEAFIANKVIEVIKNWPEIHS